MSRVSMVPRMLFAVSMLLASGAAFAAPATAPAAAPAMPRSQPATSAALAVPAPAAQPVEAAKPAAATPAAVPAPVGVLPDEDREAVRQAELAFAASVRTKDRARFADSVSEDAVFVSGKSVLHGREAVLKGWGPLLMTDAPDMEWHPETVEKNPSSGLVLSRGPWTLTGKGPNATPIVERGLFNSIWRKEKDGKWRVIFDAGCSPCPVCGETK